MINKLIVILLLVVSFISFAHAEGIEIPCDSSPKEAVLSIPEPANKLAHVVCTKYGHVINPVKDWFWTRSGGFLPVFFPSQMDRSQPKELNNRSYFKRITVKELTESEAKEKWSILDGMVDESNNSNLKGLQIVAVNNEGKKHTIYIFNNNRGYGCSPICKKENAFMLLNQDKKDVTW